MTEEIQETIEVEKEHQEFLVKITRNQHGFVRVRARNKNEAKRAAHAMSKKRLLTFYKHEHEFVNIGEVIAAPSQ